MVINRLALPRRTVLRGLGAAVALPFLDAMVPALRASAAATPVKRFGALYTWPNGTVLKNLIPPSGGKNFEMTPMLRPLEKHRDHLTIVSGLANVNADPLETGNGPHSRTSGCWLSGMRPKRSETELRGGRTVDQFAADALGKDTPLRSLELALEPNFIVGNCEGGYGCTYLNTFSWAGPDRPLPMETNPAVVFERLFGESGPGPARLAQLRLEQSVLDSVSDDLARLQQRMGPTDRQTVNDYLESVRDIERRIQQTSSRDEAATGGIEKPYGIPASYEDHAKLMFDLMFLAFRTDMTRVVAFQVAREISLMSYPQLGVSEAHHDVSHYGNDQAKIANKGKIDTYHVSLISHLVDRMATTMDGDGSLLDHSILLLGGGFGDGDLHLPHNLPVVLVGSGAGTLQAGRHVQAPFDAPFMNLGLSLLDKFDVHLESLGDSTGRLADI